MGRAGERTRRGRRARRARPAVAEPALDLHPADEALALWQRRYFDDDLPEALSTRAFEQASKLKLSADDRASGLHGWRHRALDEYRSQVAFTEFLGEVTDLGCSHDILSASVRLVRDEARHVEICRRMVLALGGDARIPGEPGWVRSDREAPLLDRVLTTTLASLCIGETLSVALLVKSRDVATFPVAKAALEQLAKDESIHSQLGWRLLPMLWPLADRKLRRELTAALPYLFEASWDAVFGGMTPGDGHTERDSFGDVLDHERQTVFDHSLEHDIVRRFEKLGIPARKAARSALGAKPRFV